MQKNKQALKKMKNEIAIIEVWSVVLYSLLNLAKKHISKPSFKEKNR
jgi:hypothetical protein